MVTITEQERIRIQGLYEQTNVKDIIETIKNNLPTIINIITSLIPVLKLPKLIYWIATGKHKELYNDIVLYKEKIESELKKRNINLTIEDITNNIGSVASEFITLMKEKAGV
jgi:hypothetical protein